MASARAKYKDIKERYKPSLASFCSRRRLRHGRGILLSLRRRFRNCGLGDCSCSTLKRRRRDGWEGQRGSDIYGLWSS
jgi:hypothetical protein